jgi:UDP-3-O-acyl-N-acetylglucosamine deacetylase
MKRLAPYVIALSLASPCIYSCRETPEMQQHAIEIPMYMSSMELQFLLQMEKTGYRFSDENFNMISINESVRRRVKEVWLEPSPKDIEKRFSWEKGHRIRTGYLKAETSQSPVLVLDTGFMDETAKSTAQYYGIKTTIIVNP